MLSDRVEKLMVAIFIGLKLYIYMYFTKVHMQSYIALGYGKSIKIYMYTKSLVNTNSFYTNFTNTHFQKVPIPHLTRTMKQKFLH